MKINKLTIALSAVALIAGLAVNDSLGHERKNDDRKYCIPDMAVGKLTTFLMELDPNYDATALHYSIHSNSYHYWPNEYSVWVINASNSDACKATLIQVKTNGRS